MDIRGWLLTALLVTPLLASAGPSSLVIAAGKGDLARVDKLLAKGNDPNRPDSAGEYALHHALYGGHTEVVAQLLQAGARVDQPDRRFGLSALNIAAVRGDTAMARVLLDHGADLEFTSADAAAASDGKRYLPLPAALHHQAFSPALLAAVQGGHLPMIELLLAAGAKPDAANEPGDSTLVLAAKMGRTAVMQPLLDSGQSLNAPAPNGDTPLLGALLLKRPEMTRLLLNLGADPAVSGFNGFAPIHGAALWGNVEFLNIILNAPVDANLRTAEGTSPLHYAASSGEPAAVDLLLAAGAAPQATANDGSSPLHFAALVFSAEIAGTLIGLGAQPDEPAKHATPEDQLASGFARMLYADERLRQGDYQAAEASYAQARPMIEAAMEEYRKAEKAASRAVTRTLAQEQKELALLSTGTIAERAAITAATVGYVDLPGRISREQVAGQQDTAKHARSVQNLGKTWIAGIDRKTDCLAKATRTAAAGAPSC